MVEILKTRLPSCEEWDKLAVTAKEDDSLMHWLDIFTWCSDLDPETPFRLVRGGLSVDFLNRDKATYRSANVGFRPVFEVERPDTLGPDGTIISAATLYMDGQPVKVPQKPTWDGDIPNYIPRSRLEFRESLDVPDYQVRAVKVGDVLIVDRVVLKRISWKNLQRLGFC